MKQFKIYAGLGGSFGGATYQGTFEFKDEDEACLEAFSMACELYESYSGAIGSRCVDDIIEDDGVDEEVACEIYSEERESWLSYYVTEV